MRRRSELWPQTRTKTVAAIKRKVGGQPLDPSGAPTEKILVPMTSDLLARIDGARADEKRTAWIRGSCEQRLKREDR